MRFFSLEGGFRRGENRFQEGRGRKTWSGERKTWRRASIWEVGKNREGEEGEVKDDF